MISVDEVEQTGLCNVLHQVKGLCTDIGRAGLTLLVHLVAVAKEVSSTMQENRSLKVSVAKLETIVRRLEGGMHEATWNVSTKHCKVLALELNLMSPRLVGVTVCVRALRPTPRFVSIWTVAIGLCLLDVFSTQRL